MDGVFEHLGALPVAAVMLGMSLIMFLDSSPIVGLLLPGDMVVVAVVASRAPGDAVLMIIGIVLGTLASWSLFFLIGTRVGPRLRRGRIGRWVGEQRWDAAEQLLTGRVARTLTLVQFLPILNAVMPLVAGGLGMRYRQFLRFAAPGTTLWAFVFGAIGVWAGVASDALLGEGASPLAVLLFASPGFIAGWVILMVLRRELAARRREPQHSSRSAD